MKKPVIEFKDFTFQYFAQAEPTLYDINLTIYEGEKVLIVGPSGSGDLDFRAEKKLQRSFQFTLDSNGIVLDLPAAEGTSVI